MRCSIILAPVLLLPALAHGQGNPYQRRARREMAVAFAGSQARAFVETGDEAALALLACSPSGARKLVEFHASGALGRVPRPPDLLRAVAMYGDDVLLFAIQHAKELEEPDAFSAFIQDAPVYALNLKSLEQGAAEVKATKLSYYAAAQNRQWNSKHLALFAGIAAIAALEALYYRFGRDGLKEQPLADVGLLLSSKEMQFRDAAKHNLTTEQQAANRTLELEIKDLKLYLKSQTAVLSLDDLRSYAGYDRQQQQRHHPSKDRGMRR